MKRLSPPPASAEIEKATSAWIARRDAGMSAAEQEAFERWKEADPRHASALARHEQAWRTLDRPLSSGKSDELVERLNALAARRRRRRTTAAALAGAVVIGALSFWNRATRTLSPAPAVFTRAIVVSTEKKALPDGSTIELKAGAALSDDFSGSVRQVTLERGAALFQVAKNPTRPFVVRAGRIDVRAVGTAFVVQLGSDQVEVLVTEGRIAVAPSDASRPPTFAGAGTSVRVNLGSDAFDPVVTSLNDSELAERLSWRAPRLEFTGTPLGDAVRLMNRYNREQMEIDPAAAQLGRLEVSGYFRADNVGTFLRLIEQTLDIKAARSGDRIVLRAAR